MFSRPLFDFKISVVRDILRRWNFRLSSCDIKDTEDEEREQGDQSDDDTRYEEFPLAPSVCVYKTGKISFQLHSFSV